MFSYFLIILIGLIGGIAVGTQSPIAGAMQQRVGGAAGSFIVHVSGAILSALLLILRGGENIQAWKTLPWYMLMAGFPGVVLYLAISVVLPKLGGTAMITLIITGQLLVNVLVDQFGWFGVPVHPIGFTRLAGIALLMFGVFLVAR